MYLVSEFLVSFPVSLVFPFLPPRTRVFPLLLTSAFASATLLPFAGRASRVIISIRDCDANFYCFPSRRSTHPPPPFSCFLTRFVPFLQSLVLILHFLQRTVFYFIRLRCCIRVFYVLFLCNVSDSKALE